MNPLISICIPAYKRIEFLKRLLDSVCIQTFKDFEVIITDDSPGYDVKQLCVGYQNKFPLFYFRNNQPLGTPENWNEAIRNAKGQWIKLMHDDDWFNNENSLQVFADAIKNNAEASFVFSAYRNIFLDKDKQNDVFAGSFRYRLLRENPATLLSRNIIGPPSVVLHRNDGIFFYDKNLKWLVDIDFYIRYLQFDKPVYLHRVLINVGMSSQQVTKEVFGVRKVEIPENFHLLDKIGVAQLKNILVYDAWWRLVRNLGVRNEKDIQDSGYTGILPTVVKDMIHWQNKISLRVLRVGFLSKIYMFICFIVSFCK